MRTHSFTARTRARKRAADVLFEADQRGFGADSRRLLNLLEERERLSAAQTPLPAYSADLVRGVAAHIGRIDDLLSSHIAVPGLDRLPAVDLAVMRVACWEILYSSEVDPVTAIDEAVAIVKSISTDESPGRVNAILDAVRRDPRARAVRDEAGPAPSEEGSGDLDDAELDELLGE